MLRKTNRYLNVNVDNIVISLLIGTKTNYKYLIRYLDKVIRLIVFILLKMIGYVKTFKFKDENNKLMSLHKNHEKQLERYKAIWTKIEDLTSVKLIDLPVYDETYMKNKIKTYFDKVYTNFCGLHLPVDDIECESFTVISNDFLILYENKYFLQLYLEYYTYKVIHKQMIELD